MSIFNCDKLHKRRGGGHSPNHKRGFTLIELILVILVMAVLISVTVAGGAAVIKKAKITRAKSELRNFAIAAETTLNENPQVSNIAATTNKGRLEELMEAMNGNLAADYRLSPEDGTLTGNIKKLAATNDDSDHIVCVSEKTDPWDNPYYVVVDRAERGGSTDSQFYMTAISAGPNAITTLDGTIDSDDLFALLSYVNGDVTSKVYDMKASAPTVMDGSTPATDYVSVMAAPTNNGVSVSGAEAAAAIALSSFPLKTFTITSSTSQIVAGSKSGSAAGATTADTHGGFTGETENGFTFVKGYNSNTDLYTYTVTLSNASNVSVDCVVDSDGKITVPGSALQVFEDGETLTLSAEMSLANLVVECYPYVCYNQKIASVSKERLNGVLLIVAYSPSNKPLSIMDNPMYCDSRFVDRSMTIGGTTYSGINTFVLLVEISQARSSGLIPINLSYKNETNDDWVNRFDLLNGDTNEYASGYIKNNKISINTGEYETIETSYDVNLSGGTVNISDASLVEGVLGGTYSRQFNQTGVILYHAMQYLLSDASLTQNGVLDTLTGENRYLITEEDRSIVVQNYS